MMKMNAEIRQQEKELLLESILNDSNQMIQISDLETYTMLYANEPARIYTGHAQQSYEGEHCYKYMMGLDEQCPFCPMLRMEASGCQETEVDNGKEIYAVKTRVTKWNGQRIFIEYAWDITEIRRSQKEFEARMQTLISSIPEAQGIFYLDLTSDECLSVNGASRSLDSMQHKTTVDDTVHQIASFVPDEEGKKEFFQFFCRNALMEAYASGKAEISKETESYFDDGSIRTAHITARFFRNPSRNHLECVIYGMDITEEKKERIQYQKELEEQLEIFHALSRDYLNIFLIDADTNTAKILKLDGYVTTGLKKNKDLSYPYDKTCQQYISERVHPDDQKMMKEAMRLTKVVYELKDKDEYVSTYKTLVDGEIHYYQFKYMRQKDTTRIVAGFQNIDALIAEEKKVQAALTSALKAEERSNQAKTVFLNSMSHDIRTPLNAMIGCTTLASAHMDNKEMVQNYLSRITTAGSHLLSLVNDILDMSHIESGKLQLNALPISLRDLIEELQKMIQQSVTERQLQLIVHTDQLEHDWILADRLRLNQIFLNILSNSVKFTNPRGKILFEVKELQGAPTGYGKYQFCVEDNGMGMSQEFTEHIFETFTREQTATVSGIQGSGLGMAIVKQIVDLMDGDIQVTSEKGKGTRMVVTLQLQICESAGTTETNRNEEADFCGKRILLVEDNELNREIATELLKDAGFMLDIAEDGTQAVEKMLNAHPGQYDLILMDIQMPQMDGYEATKKIRRFAKPEVAGIPIIAMTANAFQEDRKRAFQAGMNDYIAKPIDVTKMMETLKKYL